MSRKKSKKGKKAIWFKEVEERVLISEESREVKEEYRTGIKNYLGVQNLLEEISVDKRKREWIIYEDSHSKSRKIGYVQKKKEDSVLVEHWENQENAERHEEIRKCEGCLINKEKAYKECRAWQPKRKVLGIISKNCINKVTGLIDFPLRTLVANKDEYQETGRNELVFTSLRIVEEHELEIIEAQNLDQELVVMLKEKAREIRVKKEREIEFYTDGSLGKEEEKGIMGVGWIGIDRIDSSLVSIGNFKVVN